jgi:hypothetical protein
VSATALSRSYFLCLQRFGSSTLPACLSACLERRIASSPISFLFDFISSQASVRWIPSNALFCHDAYPTLFAIPKNSTARFKYQIELPQVSINIQRIIKFFASEHGIICLVHPRGDHLIPDPRGYRCCATILRANNC